jgi:hypothetical protein
VGDQNALQGEEEGAIENMQASHGHDRHGILTIFDNILTVGEQRADRSHPHPEGLLGGAGGGAKNGTAASFATALQR